MRIFLKTFASIGLAVLSVSALATPQDDLAKYNCMACHAMDKKLVGPAFKDVAAKYKGNAAAGSKLVEKVQKGGTGVWGQIPMPPNLQVPVAVLPGMIDYILKSAQ